MQSLKSNFEFGEVEKRVDLVNLELSNECLLANIGVDTAENERLKVWRKIQFIIHSPPSSTAHSSKPRSQPQSRPDGDNSVKLDRI